MKITVLGSGGWGTALALLLVDNGNAVTLWSHREEAAEQTTFWGRVAQMFRDFWNALTGWLR